jgi:hypothetical protein
MARTAARLPQGARVTDFVSLGVLTRTFPRDTIQEVLSESGKESVRQRLLPAHVVVYYVLSLSLFMHVSCREVLRCLLEGLKWLMFPGAAVAVAGKSGISQARTRLGEAPMKALHDRLVIPVANPDTPGAWYRRWRLVSLDGSTLDVPDTAGNARAFGRPPASRGSSAFPQLRFVSLVECGTHVLFRSREGPYRTSENKLAEEVIEGLAPGMLCLADRLFPSFRLWRKAKGTGADLVWRVKTKTRLPCRRRLPDGSYLSRIYPTEKDRRHDTDGEDVRVIEYRLHGVPGAEPLYRVMTTILDHQEAPAPELAALYHERWEIETALDEFKTHLRGAKIVLRSKTPELVRQEFYGFMMTHFAIRSLMHEAAMKGKVDPDKLSYVHAVRVIRRRLPTFFALPPSGPSGIPSGGSG